MSQIPAPLHVREDDIKALLACGAHIGSETSDASMKRYVFKRNATGLHIIDLRKTWEKIVLAARVIVAIENPKDIVVVAISPVGTQSPAQRAVLKFANYIGCRTIAGRITPGTFTNHRQIHYREPRLMIISDPRTDHQPVIEASYVNLPVIAFANTHHNLRGIDIAIPINTSSRYSIALGYWLLAREILRLRSTIPRNRDWDVMVDMFVYRDPEETEKQVAENQASGWNAPPASAVEWEGTNEPVGGDEFAAPPPTGEEWGGGENWAEDATTADWNEGNAENWGGNAGDW